MGRKITDSGFDDWTPDRLPDLVGKRYLITGANTGLGFAAAEMLAEHNADIVVASRNAEKARDAAAKLDRLGSGAIDFVVLDLSSLASVRAAAEELRERYDGFDAIINNAGIMQTPRRLTDDGHELQLATNHLGHFLLNGLLFDLVEARGGRFVPVSSFAHKRGQIHFDDLMLERRYTPTRAYCQTKLANLHFAFELDRRLRAAGSRASVVACHPGYVATNLQANAVGRWRFVYSIASRLVGQGVRDGAIPLVLAAAGQEARPGAYYGPQAQGESKGRVSDAVVANHALDAASATRLWTESERLVGFNWDEVLADAKADA